MNKTFRFFLFVGIISLSLVSCKSKQIVTEIQSATEPATVTAPEPQIVTPIVNEPVTPPAPVVPAAPAEPEITRSELFKMADGETNQAAFNKKYHVQVGAFKNHNNARNLRDKLISQGHNSFVVENDTGFLRVIIDSYDLYKDAKAKINQIKTTYPDAWVLVQKK